MIDREKVARARFERWQQILWEGGAKSIAWDELTRGEQRVEEYAAIAAIAAVMEQLREPSEAMVKHAAGKCWLPASDYGTMRKIWQAMLESAFLQQPARASEGHGHDTEEPERADQPEGLGHEGPALD